jgi:hypothetical protein
MSHHAATATQGHRYMLGNRHVIAMQSGHVVTVRPIEDEAYPLGKEVTVKASWLQPAPMVYFHGEIPK